MDCAPSAIAPNEPPRSYALSPLPGTPIRSKKQAPTAAYYHVLGGLLSPIDGKTPDI